MHSIYSELTCRQLHSPSHQLTVEFLFVVVRLLILFLEQGRNRFVLRSFTVSRFYLAVVAMWATLDTRGLPQLLLFATFSAIDCLSLSIT